MSDFVYRPIKSDREDGRFLHSDLFMRDWYKRYRPKLEYKDGMSHDDFLVWKEKVRAKLEEIVHFPEDIPPQPEPKMLWEEEREGYTVQKWEAYPEPYSVVPFLMLVPREATANTPAPAVMCYPGTWHTKESLCGEEDIYRRDSLSVFAEQNKMALQFVRNGYVAIAVEHPCFGELRPEGMPSCADFLAVQMASMGRNYQGWSTFQKKVILDWAKELDFIDSANIFTSGHSLGKYPAMFLGLLCDCVRGVIFNDSVCDTRERLFSAPEFYLWSGCYTHLIPNCEEWFTPVDLLCALAPKLLLISEGGATRDLKKISDAFTLAGAPEAFEYALYEYYQDPENRKYDGADAPPDCVGDDEFLVWANCDAEKHYFKGEIAIPWINKHCK